MIINDEYRFVFLHIPKCAGTTVRETLQSFDSREGRFTGRVDYHPALGKLDYVHIPLFALREHFRAEFEAVQDYWSFAVVRDPYSRFASSLTQYLKMYSDRSIQNCSIKEIESFARSAIDYLSSQMQLHSLLPPEYIHFQRQVDYIQLGDKQIVDSIYTVGQIDELIADVSRHTGQGLLEIASQGGTPSANRALVFRNDLLRRFIVISRPAANFLSKFLPENYKQTIRNHVYVPRDQRMKDIFESDHVRAFIGEYYAADIRLYQRSLAGLDRASGWY